MTRIYVILNLSVNLMWECSFMKKILSATVLTIGLITLTACSGGSGEAVVETKSGNITKDDLYNELKANFGNQVIRPMVEEIVITDRYKVEDKELDAEIQKLKDELGDEFDQFMESNNWTDEDLKKELRTYIAKEKAYTEDIKVSDEEIEARYNRMKEEIKAQHILVEDEDTAKEVKKKLDEGAKFDKLVEEYSQDTGTVDNDGLLDYFTAGQMDENFEDAAYDMKKGEISKPVQSNFGYHIIKIIDRRETKDLKPLEDIKADIKRELALRKVDPVEAEEKIQKIIDEADVKIKDKDLENAMEQNNMLDF